MGSYFFPFAYNNHLQLDNRNDESSGRGDVEESTRFTSFNFHPAGLVKTEGKTSQPVKEIKLNATTGFKVSHVSDKLEIELKYAYDFRILEFFS